MKPLFCFLTYGSWTANQMDSLFQTVNGIVGNVDWGESLTVVACKFPGLNRALGLLDYPGEFNPR